MTKDDLSESVSDQASMFRSAGFAASFVTKALSTPSDDLWKPTYTELSAAKAITGPSDDNKFAVSGYGEISKESLAKKLASSLPLLMALKERLPKKYDEIVDVFYSSYLTGETQAQAVSAARGVLMPAISSVQPLADDDVLQGLAILFADTYAALGAKHPTSCYRLASGISPQTNYTPELPAQIRARELELYERAIRSATRRTPITDEAAALSWKKLGVALAAKGVSAEKLTLLDDTNLAPSAHADYCSIAISFFKVIGSLPQKDSALLMRKILLTK